MRILKIVATSLLGFLLFLCLSLFGTAFLLNQTVLNPDFITTQMDKLDVATLVEEIISEQEGEEAFSEELEASLVDTIADVEPLVKEGISNAIEPVYDYLTGESETIDLASIIRNEVLSSEVIASLLDEMDIASIASEMISEELPEDIPEEFEPLLEQADEVIAELAPTIKEEIIAAADPVLDYILGESQNLSIEISTGPLLAELEDSLKEAVLESPPPEFAGLSPDEIEQHIDDYLDEIIGIIPATIELDETVLPSELPEQISEALSTAEEGLEQAREYVGYFQLGYKILIGVIVVLIIGIILLNRQVRSATRKLGSIFLTYGIIWFAGIFVARYFAGKQIPQIEEIPSYIQELLPRLVSDFSAPLQWFSMGCLIAGAALIIVSFVYKPSQQQNETE
jgi:hypothetical protein